MLIMAYYPDWAGSAFPPDKINFSRFDWIDFAFAVPACEFYLDLGWTRCPRASQSLVTTAHSQGAKVKLSIGGWTGSKYFSSAVASDGSRKTFVNNIFATYKSFDLDGIDIDWEYPGRKGASGNHFDSNDSANFLLFLKLLRATLPPTARISAAVETTTFADSKGEPMVDLADFALVLDWVLLMNYDVWGSSSDPGPNAPLHDACHNSTQADANAVSAFNAWTGANFPAYKLVLGLPSYGYISSSTVEHLQTRSKPKKKKKKQRHSDSLTVVSQDGGSDSQVQFRELIKQGALVAQPSTASDGNGTAEHTFIASGGFERRWDDCSGTPYLRSTSSGQIITYDDPESLGMKAAFAKDVGMLGVNLFDVHGDTDQWDLTDSVRKSVGLI
ncbi:glycoside hydrolase [Flammula alnicola]|nr:glycoside hydrolase [Flammula alnicola]